MARKILKPQKIDILVTPILEDINLVDPVSPTQLHINVNEEIDTNSASLIIINNEPKKVNILEDMVRILEHCDPIPDIDVLKDKLTRLGIRFNTDPKLYLKLDYWLLVCILYRSLIHLYLANPEDIIVTDWLDPHSDDYIPSEKLVAETIEELNRDLDQEVLDRIQAVADEAALRIQLDLELSGSLDREVSRLEGLINDINDLIPEEAASSNQLADKEFVHDLIATNASNFRGDWANWTAVPTDPLYYPEDYTGNKKPNNNDYLIIQNATDYDPSNTGIWRFVYKGDWDTLGKFGWEPQYRVELAFTLELLNAINSGITSLKVSNYDNYRQEIDDLFPLIAAGL